MKQEIERKSFPFKITKEIDDTGRFEGYAAVFGNVDGGRDTIEQGAFKKTLKENPQVPILWQHNEYEPIGVSVEMKEDDYGLHVVGQLVSGVQRADEARLLMLARAIKGLSIGYRAIKPVFNNGVRHLKEIALMEWSPVTFPMNTLATIEGVKMRKMYFDVDGDWSWDDDAQNVTRLLAMISFGTNFLANEAAEGDEPASVAAMRTILSSLAALLATELAEVGDDGADDLLGDATFSARLNDIFFKDSTTLSDAHRTHVDNAVKALQALLDGATPPTRALAFDGAAVKDALEAAKQPFFAAA